MSICLKFFRRLKRDTAGTALVELAILIPLLLLLIFGILEYGRLYWFTGSAQKATAIAARIAAVRPAACENVPDSIGAGDTAAKFGTLCRGAPNVCAKPAEIMCTLQEASGSDIPSEKATADEIWGRIEALLPPAATPENVILRYTFVNDLGFLGGPASPIVTAELEGVEFIFVLPLAGLAALAADDATLGGSNPNSIILPSMSASMPGEDLASGAN